MEFWGVEVKAGQPLQVEPEFGKLIHISQAALGEVKDVKGAKYVPLRMKINDQNFVIGSLSAEERPQVMFDLVFEKEFELSHDWKNGSVFFVGYIANDPELEEGAEFTDSEDEDEHVHSHENGKCDHKAAAVVSKKGAKTVGKEEETSDSEDDDEINSDDSDEEMGMAVDEDDLSGDDSDEGDEDDSDDSEEEETPQAKPSKKRAAEPAKQAAVPAKKAKSATPDNKGNKKSQTATPFPAKASGKAPAGKKSNEKSPKSAGQVTCAPCSKSFTSESALLSHKKAKHGGK